MSIKILTTKLFAPSLKPYFITRNRIVAMFQNLVNYKLILVSAPAGFGKTTAVVSWINQYKQNKAQSNLSVINKNNEEDFNLSWLSFDIADNDLTRFLNYLIHTIDKTDNTIIPTARTLIKSNSNIDIENFLIVFLNEVADCKKHILVILDDYHLIDNKEIHNAINFILEHAPTNLHFIITSRVDPPLNLGKLKASGEMLEIRANDLRFSKKETINFVKKIVNKDFDEKLLDKLKIRTEGWAVGIQLAAIAMQNKSNIEEFITKFSGNNTYIIEYLTEEVLNNQTIEIQDFLIKTSIFRRLNAEICDFVLENDNSYKLIDKLYNNNLFLIPLDENREWWRYHHLFSDLLFYRLKLKYKDLYFQLYEKAAIWCQQNKLNNEAYEYALKSNNLELAAKIFEDLGTTMIINGEASLVISSSKLLPQEIIDKHPLINVLLAWANTFAGQTQLVFDLLEKIDKAILNKSLNLTQEFIEEIEAHLILIRTFYKGPVFTQNPNDLDSLHESALFAKSKLKDDNYILLSTVEQIIGETANLTKRWDKAEDSLLKSIQIGLRAENYFVASIAARNYTECLIRQLKIQKAKEFLNEFEKYEFLYYSSKESPLKCFYYESIAKIDYFQNDLSRSEFNFLQSLNMCLTIFNAPITLFTIVGLSEVQYLQNKKDDAYKTIELGRSVKKNQFENIWEIKLCITEAKFLLFNSNLNELEFLYSKIGNNPLYKIDDYVKLYHSRIAIELSLYDTAFSELTKLQTEYIATNSWLYLSIAELYLAILFLRTNQPEKAKKHLIVSINLTYKSNFIRIYLNEGIVIYQLLKDSIASFEVFNKELFEFISKIINYLKIEFNDKAISSNEGMSDREVEVIRLLSAGLTNQEIGDKLFVALGTIKKHTNSIYTKLNVANRTQAIQKAKELKII